MRDQVDLVLGTAGHIDHGKTALVRALTGVDTDRLPAEKLRGITIDLGFAALELGKNRLAIVDVPGHERFIRNMLAGATGFDLAMLVVAADDSVMPQTREHLQILRLLGLSSGLVALTKCDLADPTWLDLVEEDVRALVAGSFLEGAPIVRTSAATGLGVIDLKAALARLCDAIPARTDPGLFRLAIDRSFTIAGHGTVVSGTVASGTLTVGEDLEWLPDGRIVRVRGLQRHDRPAESLARGARAAINLAGVHHTEVVRGNEVAAPGYLAPSQVLSVEVRGMPDALRPLRHRSRYRLHIGTADVSATLAILEQASEATREPVLAQLFLDKPVAAVHGEPFVLRAESPAATLGGGRVLQPLARRLRRSDTAGIARLAQLRAASPIERVGAALAGLGLESWTERTICRDAGVPIGEIPALLESLMHSGRMVEIPLGPRRSRRLLADVAADLEDRLLRALQRLHQASPRQSAIAWSRIAAALAYLEDDSLVSGLIERLKSQGRLVADARTAALKDHAPKLSQAERKLKNEIADAYKAGGLTPPEPSEWSTTSSTRAGTVAELLQLLCEEERLVYIGPDFYLDFDIAANLRRRVVSTLANGSSLTMAELRDLLGTTRKYAVPIGEYLDRIGLTRRVGDVRHLREPAAAPA
jgi:selenocysteine-specific elongation factor